MSCLHIKWAQLADIQRKKKELAKSKNSSKLDAKLGLNNLSFRVTSLTSSLFKYESRLWDINSCERELSLI